MTQKTKSDILGLPADRIQTKEYAIPNGFWNRPEIKTHRRLGCYSHYGVTCCVKGCNRIGTNLIEWYSKSEFAKHGDSGVGKHIDLIGYNLDGSKFLMTVDHIIPKIKGGPKVWWNLQPMCGDHNWNQGAKMEHQPELDRLLKIMEIEKIIPVLSYSVVPDHAIAMESILWHFNKTHPLKNKTNQK